MQNRYLPTQPGDLNQPCILQENKAVRDAGGGGGVNVWTDLVSPLWCKVTPIKSDETLRGGGQHDVRTALFSFRLDEYPLISIKHGIVWDNRLYAVEGIKETGSQGVFMLVSAIYGTNK